jgi:hypothetical protein
MKRSQIVGKSLLSFIGCFIILTASRNLYLEHYSEIKDVSTLCLSTTTASFKGAGYGESCGLAGWGPACTPTFAPPVAGTPCGPGSLDTNDCTGGVGHKILALQ